MHTSQEVKTLFSHSDYSVLHLMTEETRIQISDKSHTNLR